MQTDFTLMGFLFWQMKTTHYLLTLYTLLMSQLPNKFIGILPQPFSM